MPKKPEKSPENDESWPTRAAAAEELTLLLGVQLTANTLMGWRRLPGCPVPHGHAPIPRVALITWATDHLRSQGRMGGAQGAGTAPENALRERYLAEQVRNLELKNARLEESSIDAAEARSGIMRATEELKRALLEELPPKAWGLSQGRQLDETVPDLARLIGDILNRFQAQALPR